MNTRLFILHFIGMMLFLSVSSLAGAAGTVSLPKTGQATSYLTGDDGDLQMGVPWPNARFKINMQPDGVTPDGTVTDNLTGVVWLKNANCVEGTLSWENALAWSNAIASGSCGLSDGSAAGQWRLPNSKELLSLINRDAANNANWLSTSHGFANVKPGFYWSSTTFAGFTDYALTVEMSSGILNYGDKVDDLVPGAGYFVWSVRGGQSGTLVHLNITKNGHGNGSITPNLGSIEWTDTQGQGDYLVGTTVTLTASPDIVSIFNGWSGPCVVDPNDYKKCVVSLDAVKDITASFGLNGVCGSADGMQATTEPTENLCAFGEPIDSSGTGPWNWKCSGYEGGSTAICSAPLKTWPLYVTVNGDGIVRSIDPVGAIDCSGTCSKYFDHNSIVTLRYWLGQNYAFSGWSGCDTIVNNDCTVSIASARSISASFTLTVCDFKTDGTCYATFADAYSATTGGIIMIKAITTGEVVTCNRVKNVTLEGGYNDTYSSVTGVTTFGGMLLQSGTLTVKDVAVK